MKTNSSDQKPSILDTPELRRFDDFSEQIREEKKYIDMRLFDKYFPYGRPHEILQDLFDSRDKADNHKKLISFHSSFDYIAKIDEKYKKNATKYK